MMVKKMCKYFSRKVHKMGCAGLYMGEVKTETCLQ